MSYGHQRNSGIRKIRTYDEALALYESVTPIRGRKDREGNAIDIRPLGYRARVDAYTIRKNSDDGIECVLWSSPVVTFNKDGTIRLKNYSYNTLSTCNFLYEVLPSISSHLHDFKIHVNFRMGVDHFCSFVLDNKEGLLVKLNTTNNCYEVLNAKTNKVHYIKRKASSDCVKAYKDFEKYMLGNVKVRDGVFTEHEYKEVFGTGKVLYYTDNDGVNHYRDITNEFNVSSLSNLGNREAVDKLFTLIQSEDFTDKNKAVMMLATIGRHSYHASRVGEMQMIHALKKCILAKHKDECFEEVELPIGMYKKDRYGYLFD